MDIIKEHKEFTDKLIAIMERKSLRGEYSNSSGGKEVVRGRSIFPGEWYNKSTLIPRRKAKLLGRLLGKEVTGVLPSKQETWFGDEVMPPIFILGYRIEGAKLFYEIWFDTAKDAYVIFDSYMARKKTFRTLRASIEYFLDIIADAEDITPEEREEIRSYEASLLKDTKLSMARDMLDKRYGNVKDSYLFDVEKEFEIYESAVNAILESVASARSILNKLPDVKEYQRTKYNKADIKKAKRYAGISPETPASVLGKFNKYKMTGDDNGMYFVIGYSFNGINVEVWLLKDGDKSEFFAFNVSSYRILARSEKIRNIYAAITQFFGKSQ